MSGVGRSGRLHEPYSRSSLIDMTRNPYGWTTATTVRRLATLLLDRGTFKLDAPAWVAVEEEDQESS